MLIVEDDGAGGANYAVRIRSDSAPAVRVHFVPRGFRPFPYESDFPLSEKLSVGFAVALAKFPGWGSGEIPS